MKTLSSFYDMLGVAPAADPETLRKAYRRLARRHHPDVSADPRAHENMARINEAFATLTDPTRRAEYDAMLAGGGLSDSAPSPRQKAPPKPIVVRLRSRLTAHATPVYAAAFAPDSGELITSGFDNELLWWSEESETPRRRVRVEGGVISVLRPLEGDRMIAAGSAETHLGLWRMKGDKVELWKTTAEEWVGPLSLSPDGERLAAGSLHRARAVIDARTGESLYRKEDHSEAVTAMAWSTDSRRVASGSADATVKLYDAATGALLHTFRQIRSVVTSIAFSPDGRYLAVAGVDLSIRVFNLSDGELAKMMYGHTKPIEDLSFHPNGWLVASASRDGTVGLWNAAKGVGNVRIEASNRPLATVAFSPDGKRLAAAGQDKVVRLWEVAAKEQA